MVVSVESIVISVEGGASVSEAVEASVVVLVGNEGMAWVVIFENPGRE